ncbi:MAG: hypothetical protein GYA35_04920 [Thermoanaerobaculaceae bacterium]|nr:hypothetical protein [Thermoanaerobaculaceae bacterium]
MRKLLIIGIDGGTLELINRFVSSGKLPFFRKIMEDGCYGELKSTVPALTPPAWTSSFTGVNPGKHNIFDFFRFDKETKSMKIISSLERKYPSFWEILTKYGIKTGVYNIPCSYPADIVNGFMVTGMGTPSGCGGFAFPKDEEKILNEIKRKKFGANSVLLEKNRREDFLNDIYATTEIDEEIAVKLLKKYNPQVFMYVYDESDRVMHFFWHDFDENHPKHDKETIFKDAILNYYERMEDGIKKFLKEFGECDLVIYSDHGFGPLYKDVYVNRLLWKWGYLKTNQYAKESAQKPLYKRILKEIIPTKMRRYYREKIKPSPLSNPLGYVDFDSSTAVYTSVSGRSIIILKEEERERIKQELKEKLENYIDEKTGIKPFKEVFFKEEIYQGEWLSGAPDIIIEEDGRYAFKTDWSLEEIKDSSQYGAVKSGSHREKGFVFFYGNSFKKAGKIENCQVMDICPTILHLLKLPVGSEMDGKVIIECLKDCGQIVAETCSDLRSENGKECKVDEEEIKEKLKNLGYM